MQYVTPESMTQVKEENRKDLPNLTSVVIEVDADLSDFG